MLVDIDSPFLYIAVHGSRGGSRTAATSKMERFVIMVNGLKSLSIITKHSNLDVATVLDLPLGSHYFPGGVLVS